jgi:superfamily II DNA or RNA helicase
MSAPLPPLSANQNAMLDFHWDFGSVAWFAPPGLGKTRTYLELIHRTGDETIIAAPKLVCQDTFPRENRKWGFNMPMRFLNGKEKHLRGREQISLITPEAMPWLVEKLKEERKPRYKLAVLDELSKWKNHRSVRAAAYQIIRPRIEFTIGGTGTPVGAHLKDLFGEIMALDGGETLGDDYERFIRTNFHEDPYTCRIVPYHDTEERLLKALRNRAISFDINDLDMPALKHVPYLLDMPAAAREAYAQMHAESAVEELDLYAVNAAVRSGKLRQMASGGVLDINGGRKYLHTAKAEVLKEILEENDGRPVMVFFEFMSDYLTICQVLGYDVPVLYGKTTSKDAQKWVKQWNAGRIPVFALHPRSAAYGLNLQDAGNIVVWFTVPWSYELINQGIARIWRQGQKNKVISYYLLVEKTEDERVYARVGEREGTHNRVMKGLLRA